MNNNNKISEDEMVEFLKTMLSINITRDQLTKPSKEILLYIYGRFLEDFGCNSLDQPDIKACDSIMNIENMKPMIYSINIAKFLSQFLVRLGIPDFTLLDILQPKRSRTYKIISTLCKFYLKFFKNKVYL